VVLLGLIQFELPCKIRYKTLEFMGYWMVKLHAATFSFLDTDGTKAQKIDDFTHLMQL